MRKSTFLWLMLAAFCGVALFYTTQRVHDARAETVAFHRAIETEEEFIRILQTEWSNLNRPSRLERLAKTWLKLVPLKGSQFVRLEEIPLRTQKPQAEIRKPEKEVVKVVSSPVKRPCNKKPVNHSKNNVRRFSDVIKSLEVE